MVLVNETKMERSWHAELGSVSIILRLQDLNDRDPQ